jgi:hypothetical protein
MHIMGWMSRADQTTKVKDMFVDPNRSQNRQAPHRTRRLRIVVGESDLMTLSGNGLTW